MCDSLKPNRRNRKVGGCRITKNILLSLKIRYRKNSKTDFVEVVQESKNTFKFYVYYLLKPNESLL